MLIQTGISIDGTDITDLIAYEGVQWKRNDIDGPNSGRTLSGLMIRDRVATKIRLDITCTPLPLAKIRTLLNLIYPEFVTVTYDDPMEGTVTKTMYSNNNGAKFLKLQPDELGGEEYWDNITFPLIER
jgi:hypothetical protein